MIRALLPGVTPQVFLLTPPGKEGYLSLPGPERTGPEKRHHEPAPENARTIFSSSY
jgi:hypothetical protein